MKWVQWNGEAHKKALNEAFWDSMFLLSEKFTQVITENRWAWPRGQSPRDIIDMNGIRTNQYGPLRYRENVVQFIWTPEYAIYVHEGVTLRNGTVLPARPWTRVALREFDMADKIAKLYRRKAGG